MTYRTAIENYGTDKPDIRYDLTLKDVTEIAKKSEFTKFKEKEKVKCIIFEKGLSRKEIENLETIVKGYGLELFWLKYQEGNFSGPICKFFNPELLKEFNVENLYACSLLFVAGDERASLALGGVRNELISNYLPPKKEQEFIWVTDFPMFQRDEVTHKLGASHHMFVMPKDQKQLEDTPENVIGRLYDLVLNGVELGSGSIRIHNRELQERVMGIIGFDKSKQERDFGCLLQALEYGAPPHGGIALGVDRLAVIMLDKKSIQEVIAFPKTLSGLGLLEDIPSEVEPTQLDELHIKIKENERTKNIS
jgi:aspartyl-tRNA synthetase